RRDDIATTGNVLVGILVAANMNSCTLFLIPNFSFPASHQQDYKDADRDWDYHIKTQRGCERCNERFMECLADLCHLIRHQATVDLADAFGCAGLFQKLLLCDR